MNDGGGGGGGKLCECGEIYTLRRNIYLPLWPQTATPTTENRNGRKNEPRQRSLRPDRSVWGAMKRECSSYGWTSLCARALRRQSNDGQHADNDDNISSLMIEIKDGMDIGEIFVCISSVVCVCLCQHQHRHSTSITLRALSIANIHVQEHRACTYVSLHRVYVLEINLIGGRNDVFACIYGYILLYILIYYYICTHASGSHTTPQR